jgi:hypothetical protein
MTIGADWLQAPEGLNLLWKSMSEIDCLVARLGGRQPAASDQRELRSIPRRGRSTSSRIVEVVRLPPRGSAAGQDQAQARRPAFKVRAGRWDNGFPARSAALPSPSPQPVAAETADLANKL